MTDEIKTIIDKSLEQTYNNGRLQGIHEFYLMLRDTHKTPEEIRDYLLTTDIYAGITSMIDKGIDIYQYKV